MTTHFPAEFAQRVYELYAHDGSGEVRYKLQATLKTAAAGIWHVQATQLKAANAYFRHSCKMTKAGPTAEPEVHREKSW